MKAWFLHINKLVLEMLAALAVCVYAGHWLAGDTSLRGCLSLAAHLLPAGQTLEFSEVNGSVLQGGTIGKLEWKQGLRQVQAQGIEIEWNLDPLLHNTVHVPTLHVRNLRVDDRAPAEPPSPPINLVLPVQVDATFAVDTLEWVASPSVVIEDLSGRYVFDSTQHKLHKAQARISSGKYFLEGSVQATSPMTLDVTALGEVQARHPSTGRPLPVQARATLQGGLSGVDAVLELRADLAPVTAPSQRNAMQAQVSARLRPWHVQPLDAAKGQWQALDLAVLWPSAPQTLLDGTAAVQPDGKGWQATLLATNRRSGLWDQHLLPVDKVDLQTHYADGHWNLKTLHASLAGGTLNATGAWAPNVPWHGEAKASSINPVLLDGRLASARLDGTLNAQRTRAGTTFDMTLRTSAGAMPIDATRMMRRLQIKQLHAQGLWNDALTRLDAFTLETPNAHLQGTLALNTRLMDGEIHLQAQVPGAVAHIDGTISATAGQGEAGATLTDAAQTVAWLQNLPDFPLLTGATTVRGTGAIAAHWQGGWQNNGRDLQLRAQLDVPELNAADNAKGGTPAWSLRGSHIEVTGQPAALQARANGQLDMGTNHFSFRTEAGAQRTDDGNWKAQIDALQASVAYREWEGAWSLQLDKSVSLGWTQSDLRRSMELAGGSISLQGPFTSVVSIKWSPAHWTQQQLEKNAKTAWHTEWSTEGQIEGLGLDWLERLGQVNMAQLGLYGDLTLAGHWSAQSSKGLQMVAALERTSGDLQLPSEETGASLVTAGVRSARIELAGQGDRLMASLQWDSARAGQLHMQASTKLQLQDGQWSWPEDAPISGMLRAQLPQVGLWSLVAPPGWRLRGTVDADAAVSGTRTAPQWKGTLKGDDFTVRSTLDGIDFNRGRLRINLAGRELDITDFTLQGADAGGTTGGSLTLQGKVQLPDWRSHTALAPQVRVDLNASAQGLRVSTRADQRLVVSGQLEAHLNNSSLQVRGTLVADQGLYILSEDSVPRLGTDVRLLSTDDKPAGETTPKSAASTTRTLLTPDVALTLDLGQNFSVKGHGLTARLEGKVLLTTTPDYVPRLTGELHTVNGTYKAYGQELDIEDGVLRFTGPYDNPALNVLAIRPNLQQRVGVQIGGNVLLPVVRLYSDPDLPEVEKLTWLVVGRSAASGGAQTAMLQQAGMALLGGSGPGISGGLAQTLGLDEISMNGLVNSEDSAASTTAGATVTLGKRISRNFYVAYERSLAGAFSTFYVFYDLSRRFTLRGQTGEQSAVDLILTTRYD